MPYNSVSAKLSISQLKKSKYGLKNERSVNGTLKLTTSMFDADTKHFPLVKKSACGKTL